MDHCALWQDIELWNVHSMAEEHGKNIQNFSEIIDNYRKLSELKLSEKKFLGKYR